MLIHVNLYLDFSGAYPQKWLTCWKRKFGLWRNNSRFWKVKVNSLPSLGINWYLAEKFVVNWELGTAISTLLSRSPIPDPETSSWFSKTHPTVADSKNKSLHGSWKDFRLLSLLLHPFPPTPPPPPPRRSGKIRRARGNVLRSLLRMSFVVGLKNSLDSPIRWDEFPFSRLFSKNDLYYAS